VEAATMAQFSAGRAIGTLEHSDSSYSPQEIVERARSRIGENSYHILRNNCEHFCNWCISGRSSSPQVERSLTHRLLALAVLAVGAHRVPQLLEPLRSMVLRGHGAGPDLAGYRHAATGQFSPQAI
jgi:hypothetical protein